MLSSLNNFQTVSLDEMNNVKLMSRFDTKFVFSISKLTDLLSKIAPFYKVLEINNDRVHEYKSIYYDTNEHKFYLDHHNSRVNRNKIRFRKYVGSGLTFLEIKLKNNKGKTIKKRMRVENILEKLSVEHQEYVNRCHTKFQEFWIQSFSGNSLVSGAPLGTILVTFCPPKGRFWTPIRPQSP